MIRPHLPTPLSSGLSECQFLEYGMKRTNKAHTATANRVARRLNTSVNTGPGYDVQTDDIIVEVETTASILDAEARLRGLPVKVYIAMTNKEGVDEALIATEGSRVGIMDPRGNVVRESAS